LYGNFAARSIRPGPTIFINGESPGSLLAIDDTEADLNSASSAGAFGPTTASADTLPDPAGTARSASLGAASGTAADTSGAPAAAASSAGAFGPTTASADASTSPPDTLPRIIPSDFDALVADALSSGTTAASDAGNAAPDAPDAASFDPVAASSIAGLDPRAFPPRPPNTSASVIISLNPLPSPLILNNFYVI
jgi:hypothetical protein